MVLWWNAVSVVHVSVTRFLSPTGKCRTGGILNIGAAMKKLSERKQCKNPPDSEEILKPTKDETEAFYINDGCYAETSDNSGVGALMTTFNLLIIGVIVLLIEY